MMTFPTEWEKSSIPPGVAKEQIWAPNGIPGIPQELWSAWLAANTREVSKVMRKEIFLWIIFVFTDFYYKGSLDISLIWAFSCVFHLFSICRVNKFGFQQINSISKRQIARAATKDLPGKLCRIPIPVYSSNKHSLTWTFALCSAPRMDRVLELSQGSFAKLLWRSCLCAFQKSACHGTGWNLSMDFPRFGASTASHQHRE